MINSCELYITNKTNYEISEYEKTFYTIWVKVIEILNIKENLELSLVITDDIEQNELNKKYRNKNYIADVLTFPLEDTNEFNFYNLSNVRILGDIFICYKQALKQAKEYGHSLKRELSFLFVHGCLHILGYDHQNKNDEKIMFSLQKKILNDLNITRKL